MKRILPALLCIAVLAGLGFVGMHFWSSPGHAKVTTEVQPEGPEDQITLNPTKFLASHIETATPERRELQSRRIVPGKIEYDAWRHVQLKSPFDGLIRELDVKVGDRVTEGTVLAIVDSPDLGDGRAEVLLRETDLEQAVNEHDWWHQIQSNLEELLQRLERPSDSSRREKDSVEVLQLEKEFAGKVLGDYRQQIMTAYSRMRLAEKLSSNVKPAGEAGGISVRTMLELGTARDTATAEYAAACEQATFEVKQKHLKAESAMKNAERRLAVARQRLSVLVNQPYDALKKTEISESLSAWPVTAPFTGTVEEILVPSKERVQTSQGLFQLADTSHLWVQAQIREKDWSSLSVKEGQEIEVQTPALPGQTLKAKISFVGRAVDLETRAVPLTAEIDNTDGLLRPGMIVRVLIPHGSLRECLTVPQSAVTSNDGKTFVFVQTGEREFQRRDVTTGISVDPWIEITSGVEPGDKVVVAGTAILKAEILLVPED